MAKISFRNTNTKLDFRSSDEALVALALFAGAAAVGGVALLLRKPEVAKALVERIPFARRLGGWGEEGECVRLDGDDDQHLLE